MEFWRGTVVAGLSDHHPNVSNTGARLLGRELSAIRNVATVTATSWRQRGHLGFMLLPFTPSRYESRPPQCGQGPNHAVAIRYHLTVGRAVL